MEDELTYLSKQQMEIAVYLKTTFPDSSEDVKLLANSKVIKNGTMTIQWWELESIVIHEILLVNSYDLNSSQSWITDLRIHYSYSHNAAIE